MHKSLVDPLVKWTGSKAWVWDSPEALALVQDVYAASNHRALVSPFLGAGSIELRLAQYAAQYAEELGCKLNVWAADVNRWLINAWEHVDQLEALDNSNGYWDPENYYEVREDFNGLISQSQMAQMPLFPGKMAGILTPEEMLLQAQRYIWLVRHGFNGLSRFNSSGFFNTPMGRASGGNLHNPASNESLSLISRLSRDWVFECMGYEKFIQTLAPVGKDGGLLLCDPPYDSPDQTGFVGYYGGFTWADQESLAFLCREWHGSVLAFNRATDRIMDLYKGLGFTTHQVLAPRRNAANGDRTPVLEMIAVKL